MIGKGFEIADNTGIADYVLALLQSEEQLSSEALHMTANENVLSRTAERALASVLSQRYHIGTSNDYHFNHIAQKSSLLFRGLPNIYRLESLSHEVLRKCLKGTVSDTRMLSGMHAMMSAISSLTEPGDMVLSVHPDGGGHFATGNLINRLGRRSVFIEHDPRELLLSLSHLKKLKQEHKNIKAVFLDDSAPLYRMPVAAVRDILGKEVTIVYDASHTLGLIMGDAYINPLKEGCDVIQGNTHKTFPGPQKGLLHFADKSTGEKAMEVIGSSLVSSQHTHHAIALYITILEMEMYGRSYAQTTIENARLLSEYLAGHGLQLLSNGKSFTDSNQFLLRVQEGMTNHEAYRRLHESHICVNVKNVFHQNVIRIGVQELTRWGMKGDEMKEIADILRIILLEGSSQHTTARVDELRKTYNSVHFSFDSDLEKISMMQ
ncbi:hypothetical protein [Chitinophaga nivalis]|uniref:Serine hydroxymethyltransferase-like domain-containing protein n=1 Tax=Chitinophaga nivalis TaxID=2991709 RepID=A0ABT3IKB2_9BACT|nr:hypothetical protein [Chitinophaga nivalis]MCW3465921.1 hypothetical protein [Chitinophaga nivalis]MCW3484388.1 hypothetical protein [Chitinophaga nivalis]